MRLEWLLDILAVADLGSLSNAARQRNATCAFEAVESDRGLPWRRDFRPYDEADGQQAFLVEHKSRIRELAAGLRDFVAEIKMHELSIGNQVTIASQQALATPVAPRLAKDLATVSSVSVKIQSGNRDACHAALLTKQVEIAIVYETDDEPFSNDA